MKKMALALCLCSFCSCSRVTTFVKDVKPIDPSADRARMVVTSCTIRTFALPWVWAVFTDECTKETVWIDSPVLKRATAALAIRRVNAYQFHSYIIHADNQSRQDATLGRGAKSTLNGAAVPKWGRGAPAPPCRTLIDAASGRRAARDRDPSPACGARPRRRGRSASPASPP